MGMWYGRGSKYGSRSVSTGDLLISLLFIPTGALLILGMSAIYVHSPAGQKAEKERSAELRLKQCIRYEYARRNFTLEELSRPGWTEKIVNDYCEAT